MPARVRFVIASFARSGTHFLESALNRHPQVQCRWEPFNPLVYTPLSSAAAVLNELWAREGVVGFPAHWEWQGRNEWTDLWDVLRADKELRVVLLHRENLLRQYVSKLLLDKTRVHAAVSNEKVVAARPTVRIDVREMLTYMFIIETSMETRRRWFADSTTFPTTYERLTGAEGDQEMLRLLQFLDVEPVPLSPLTLKQETRPLQGVIENYDEVTAVLRRSGWGHFAVGGPEIPPLP
jgi:hypothetical protein